MSRSGQAWSAQEQIAAIGEPRPNDSSTWTAERLIDRLKEFSASESNQLQKWLAQQEKRAEEERAALELLVCEALPISQFPASLNEDSVTQLPGATLSEDGDELRISARESEGHQDLEVLVLPEGQTSNGFSKFAKQKDLDSAESPSTLLPFACETALQSTSRQQRDRLEEWAQRQEMLRREAYARMLSLVKGPTAPSRGGPEQAPAVRPHELKTGWELPASSSNDADTAKDLGETGGTPDRTDQSETQQSPSLPCLPKSEDASLARLVFLICEDTSGSSTCGRFVSFFMVATIVLSTMSFILESDQNFKERPPQCAELLNAGLPLTVDACEPVPLVAFYIIETVCIAIFTVEYLVRLMTSYTEVHLGGSLLQRTFKYAALPLNIIDVLAVVPYYLQLATGEVRDSLRMLRLARVLRLFKLTKHHKGIRLCIDAMVSSGLPLSILMFFNLIIGIIFASVMVILEGQEFSVHPDFTSSDLGEDRHEHGVFVRLNSQGSAMEITPFFSIPMALWWVFTTMTTVGYGDMYPTTWQGKSVGVVCFYVGIILLALPIGVLSSNFEAAYARYQAKDQGLTVEEFENSPTKQGTRRSFLGGSVIIKTKTFGATPWWPSEGGLGRQIFQLLNDPSSSKLSKLVSYFITVVIILTTGTMILESLPDFNRTPDACFEELTVENCKPRPFVVFALIETVCIIVFTIDYVLRIVLVHSEDPRAIGADLETSAAKATLKYALQWLNIVDLMAIVPFYLTKAGFMGSSAAVLRVLRLIRVFRLLKSPKLRTCVDMILNIVSDSLPGIASVFSLTSLVCVLSASCLWFAEGSNYSVTDFSDEYPMGVYVRANVNGFGREPTPFTSISHCFWWFFTTATTVGYGDEFPTSAAGRVIAVVTFYAGVVLMAIKLTIVGGSLKKHFPSWNAQES